MKSHCLIVILLCKLESEFIQGIIKVISLKLSSLFPKDTNGLVGIDSQVEKLMSLKLGSPISYGS